jgi:hypothetical protein
MNEYAPPLVSAAPPLTQEKTDDVGPAELTKTIDVGCQPDPCSKVAVHALVERPIADPKTRVRSPCEVAPVPAVMVIEPWLSVLSTATAHVAPVPAPVLEQPGAGICIGVTVEETLSAKSISDALSARGSPGAVYGLMTEVHA